MLKDVAYQAQHAAVLEQHGHDRRASRSYWLGGSFGDGKGEPGQSNSVSHGCVPARFKQREHRQHREERLMAPRSLFSAYAPPLLTREQAKALADRVLSFAKADETRVNISSGWSGNTRFAGGEITTSGGITDTTRHRHEHGRQASRVGVDERARRRGARRTVDLAERLARLAPEDPEIMPELGPQTYSPVNSYIDARRTWAPRRGRRRRSA